MMKEFITSLFTFFTCLATVVNIFVSPRPATQEMLLILATHIFIVIKVNTT